jgi:hypothetical protein
MALAGRNEVVAVGRGGNREGRRDQTGGREESLRCGFAWISQVVSKRRTCGDLNAEEVAEARR